LRPRRRQPQRMGSLHRLMRYWRAMTRSTSRPWFSPARLFVASLAAAPFVFVALAAFVPGCGPKKDAEVPEGEGEADPAASSSSSALPRKTADGTGDAPGPLKKECAGFEVDLQSELSKAACEVERKADEKLLETKDVLEVKAIANPAKVAPGGRVDVIVTFTNKKKGGTVPLSFTVNPFPKFEIEAYDAKGRRVDVPSSSPPSPSPQVAEEKTARVTLSENGKGFVALGWDAVKTRWAPEKVKGAAIGASYPRVATGPLPKGKYTLKVITPLVGVFEGIDHEISNPKVEIEISK
jgi:hypothetical protein